MIVKAWKVGESRKGDSQLESYGEYEIFSWIINATQKAVKGGELIVYDAQITSLKALPESAIIEIESKWYKVASPAVGMLGMYRQYLTESVRPDGI